MDINAELFDRCIDVYVYDKAHNPIATVCTPEYGPKPEIKVEGTILSRTFQIAGKVTITNLERSIPVENAKYLMVEMYYGAARTKDSMRKRVLYEVLFADQSKQPPNRQVCFNCIVAGTSPSLMSWRTSIGSVDAEGKPLEQSLRQVLTDVIKAYNKGLESLNQSWYNDLRLDEEPELRMSSYALIKFEDYRTAAQWTDTPISDILDSLTVLSTDTEPIEEGATVARSYISFNYYVDKNKLVVAETPSNAFIPIAGQSEMELNYVLTAYRCGPQIHIRALFDPRIHQDVRVSINSAYLSGKKAAGEMIPLVKDPELGFVLFHPVGGIQFVFSTTNENWMTMQGVMYV